MSGGGSGGGTNTIQQSSAPPSNFVGAYGQLLNQAQNTAQTPYQQYSGNLVAPLSPDQTAGISQVENAANTANPYINAATNEVQGAQGIANPFLNAAAQEVGQSTQDLWGNTQQFSPGAVQQYESPYTQNVLNTTVAAENNQDAQQQQGVVGNAISAGAWGGDRSAVAQGIVAGQQAIANNATNANIENTGYNNALQEFNTQQTSQLGANEANSWLASQGAGTLAGIGQQANANALTNANALAGLGTTAQNAQLTGANGLLTVGSQEQQLAQSELNVPYEQFQAAQAYPYQQASWLQGLETNLGSSAGGTGTTISPAANPFSQAAGTALGAGGLGLAAYNSGLFSGGSGAAATGILGATGAQAADAAATGSAAFGGYDAAAAAAAAAAGTAGAEGGADALGAIGGALAFAKRGGIIPFPSHRVRGGGINPANDDWEPIQHRAYGGVAIPQLSGGSTGAAPVMGGNGVSIPQLGGISGQGSIPALPTGAPTGLNGNISSYLTNTAAGASHATPTVYTPPAPAAGPPAPSLSTPQNYDQFIQAGESSDPTITQQIANATPNPYTGLITVTSAVNGQTYQLNPGAFPDITGSDTAGGMGESPSAGGGGGARGGSVSAFAHRDDGGGILSYLPSWLGGSDNSSPAPSPSAGLVPTGDANYEANPSSGIRVSTSPDRADKRPESTADNSGAAPIAANGDIISQGRPVGRVPAELIPAARGDVPPPAQGGIAPTGHAGDALSDPNLAQSGGIAPSAPQSAPQADDGGLSQRASDVQRSLGLADEKQAREDKTNSFLTSPWLALARAGFGMAAGTSPQFGVNLGRGAEQGIQALEEIPHEKQEITAQQAAQANFQAVQQLRAQQGYATQGTGLAAAAGAPSGGIAGGGLDPTSLYRRGLAFQASGTKEGIDAGNALIAQATEMMKSGVQLNGSGGINPIPGANDAAAQKAFATTQATSQASLPADIYKANARPRVVGPGEVLTNTLPPSMQGAINGMGQGNGQPAAQPDAWDNFATRNNAAENSTGNPAVANGNHVGNGQFSPETWLSTIHQALPQTQQMPADQVLAMRANPDASQAMTKAYAQQNAPILAQAGLPVNAASLRLAHWFGPQGAIKLANAPANAPIEQILGPDVARSSNGLQGQTAGALIQRVARQFGTAPMSMPGQQRSAGTQLAQADTGTRTDASPTASPNGAFQPSRTPTPAMIPDTSPIPFPPPSPILATPGVIRRPDGSIASTVSPMQKPLIEAIGKTVGEAPAELAKLSEAQGALVGMHDEVVRNAQAPGWYQSGAGSEWRQDIGKAIDGAIKAVGGQPLFNGNAIATNEEMMKNSGNLSLKMAAGLGGRILQSEILSTNKSVPNMGNTPFGNIAVTHMLLQQNQRSIDRTNYIAQAAQDHSVDPVRAGTAFDAARPPELYVQRGLAGAANEAYPQIVAGLKANPSQGNIAYFNRQFGDGTAQTLLGQ